MPDLIPVYVASKAYHAPMWRQIRGTLAVHRSEFAIQASWIDIDVADSLSVDDVSTDLWRKCVEEASSARLLVAYHARGDEWKGALVEIGAALAHEIPVYVIGAPPGSWAAHPLVFLAGSFDDALSQYGARP